MARSIQSSSLLLLNKLGRFIGTGFGSGLSPVAPGTAGSLVALVIYYFLPLSGDSIEFYSMIVVGTLLGVWATGTLVSEADEDPGKAVWDEFVGLWVTCLLLPKELGWLAAAFVCFRILDVLKPWPARRLESLHGGLGIMADDLMVGIYGAILLNAVRLVFFP
jgi:phosphatidylglycerophosphatase A